MLMDAGWKWFVRHGMRDKARVYPRHFEEEVLLGDSLPREKILKRKAAELNPGKPPPLVSAAGGVEPQPAASSDAHPSSMPTTTPFSQPPPIPNPNLSTTTTSPTATNPMLGPNYLPLYPLQSPHSPPAIWPYPHFSPSSTNAAAAAAAVAAAVASFFAPPVPPIYPPGTVLNGSNPLQTATTLFHEDPRERARWEYQDEKEKLRLAEERKKIEEKRKREQRDVEVGRMEIWRDRVRRDEEEEMRRRLEIHAATTIQRIWRGFTVRRDYVDVKINPIAQERDPIGYFAESLLHNIVTNEIIPDIVVEICEDEYMPISATTSFRAHRAKYHILEEVLREFTNECSREVMEECIQTDMYRLPAPEPDEQVVLDLAKEVISEDLSEIVQDAINDFAYDCLLDSWSEEAFEMLFEEMVVESKLLEEGVEDYFLLQYFNGFLEGVINQSIKEIMFELSVELHIKIYIKKRPKHLKGAKSVTLNTVMERIVDGAMLSTLLGKISQGGTSLLVSDGCERIVDGIILDQLLDRIISLRTSKIAVGDIPSTSDMQ
ncbi:hypothetical protein HDU97_003583 [Phlyctochytrium planicorne]|nr:hypothetical protein HDU97_003583 [Phlyctochytrium planicorne]